MATVKIQPVYHASCTLHFTFSNGDQRGFSEKSEINDSK